MKLYRLVIILFISLLVLPSATALADSQTAVTPVVSVGTNNASNDGLPTITFTVHHQNNPNTAELQNLQLVICESRQSVLNGIMDRMTTRMTDQLNFFNGISDNLETYYSLNRLTVNNYSQIEAQLNKDLSSSSSELSAMASSNYLDCVGTNALGLVTTFKTDSQNEIKDLQTYKTDLLNLTVMMKAATPTKSESTKS